MKALTTILAIAALLGLAGGVYAGSDSATGGKGGKIGKGHGKFAALNLTEDQKAQIKAIHEDAKNQIKAVFTDEQLKKITDAKGQGKEARKAARQAGKAGLTDDQKAQIKAIHKAAKDKIKALLTAEQQNQLKQKFQNAKGKVGKGEKKKGGKSAATSDSNS